MRGRQRAEQAAAVALTGVVAAFHAVRLLHAGGLWRDEAGAARLATLPTLAEVSSLFQHEAFPLLFPVTVRAWTFLTGGGDLALRAFGFTVGLGLAAVLWWNARAARTVPLLSLALLGLDVPFLVYGDSLRGYGLGSALLLLTYGLLARLLAGPARRAPAAPAGWLPLAAIASVQVLLSNAALLLALCAAAVAVAAVGRRWRLAGWIAGCGALAALSLLPYAGPLAGARRQWSVIVVYPTRLIQIWQGFMGALGPRPVVVVLLALLCIGLGGFAHVSRRGPHAEPADERLADLALFAALTIPLAMAACAVFLKALSYKPRPWYFLPLLALLASALDTLYGVLRRAGGRRFAAVPIAAVALLAAAQAVPLWEQLTERQTDVDLVARQVARSAAPGDLVVVNSWYYGVSFNRYYAGAAPWLTLPDLADHRIHRYDLLKVRLAAAQPIDGVLAAVAAALRNGHRVWLVGGVRRLRAGEALPALPPAPLSPEGWHDWPYTTAWSQQLGVFVASHAAHAAEIAVPVDAPVSDLEDVPLVVVEGWRGA